MPATIFAIVLLAAALHAGWNAAVKGSGDKTATTIMVAAGAGAIGLVLLPFLAAPATASRPFIAASAAVHIIYFLLVARVYRAGDMNRTYPLMRGLAPLLVAAYGVVFLGTRLPVPAWAGIAVISLGILTMSLARRPDHARAIAYALANAAVIAGYTVIDGLGVRRSAAPLSYTLWVFLLTGACLLLCLAARRGARAFAGHSPRTIGLGLAGGAASLAAYGLSLWAMTRAPIAMVAALRETSIMFAALIAIFALKEQIPARRIVAACAIALGAIILRIA